MDKSKSTTRSGSLCPCHLKTSRWISTWHGPWAFTDAIRYGQPKVRLCFIVIFSGSNQMRCSSWSQGNHTSSYFEMEIRSNEMYYRLDAPCHKVSQTGLLQARILCRRSSVGKSKLLPSSQANPRVPEPESQIQLPYSRRRARLWICSNG